MSINNGKHETSIFDCSDQDFRKRVVEKINSLILKSNDYQSSLSELRMNISDLQIEVDNIKSELD
jgi:hypothetical protein